MDTQLRDLARLEVLHLYRVARVEGMEPFPAMLTQRDMYANLIAQAVADNLPVAPLLAALYAAANHYRGELMQLPWTWTRTPQAATARTPQAAEKRLTTAERIMRWLTRR